MELFPRIASLPNTRSNNADTIRFDEIMSETEDYEDT